MSETTPIIDHQRRAEIHSHARDLLAINRVEIDASERVPLIVVAERLGYLSIDPSERATLGLPELAPASSNQVRVEV
jgi:hypothetical protein